MEVVVIEGQLRAQVAVQVGAEGCAESVVRPGEGQALRVAEMEVVTIGVGIPGPTGAEEAQR
jgi:hypothetical protein